MRVSVCVLSAAWRLGVTDLNLPRDSRIRRRVCRAWGAERVVPSSRTAAHRLDLGSAVAGPGEWRGEALSQGHGEDG